MKAQNKRVVVRLSCLLLIALLAREGRSSAQQQSKPNAGQGGSARSGAISGRVLTEDGQPVGTAQVMVYGFDMGTAPRSTSTDLDGNFSFKGLARQVYRISSSSPGYVLAPIWGGEERVCRIGDVLTLTLIKGAVITGRVTDRSGEPVVAVSVVAIRVRDAEGRPVRYESAPGGRRTDDRGIYRLYGLSPGAYLVVANTTSGPSFMPSLYDDEVPTYFPSSSREGASEVIAQAGSEITGINIQYRGERGHSISGTVDGVADGSPYQLGTAVNLTHAASAALVGIAIARQTPEGRMFAFSGIADGEYLLIARGIAGLDQFGNSTTRRIVVRSADVSGIKLTLLPTVSVAGRVVLETLAGATRPAECEKTSLASLEDMFVQARRDETGRDGVIGQPLWTSRAIVNEKGEFTLRNLIPGSFRVQPDLPGDQWYLKSVTLPGATPARKPIDAASTGLTLKAGDHLVGMTITIAEGAVSFGGRIKTGKEANRVRWSVHLVPVEAALADDVVRYAEVLAKADGSFSMSHLAPGRYQVLARAVPDDQSVEQLITPVAWNSTDRTKLRHDAQATANEIEVKTCRQVTDYVLNVVPPGK